MRKFVKTDILNSNTISTSELNNEIKLEISVLSSLDIFTNAHVQGVVKTTTAMCQRLNMPYEELKKCVLAAYLHDVGKIKIPPEILQKKGRLTDEEFKEMKKHTIYGYEICMEYPNFRHLAKIVRAHHENLDGTGYPDGLKEDEIPYEAKLLKVADVYDALTQRRQYKDGYKQSEALNMMLNDVTSGKMSAEMLEVLLLVVLDDLKEKNKVHLENIKKYNENLNILHELESIYKEIYDRGFTKKLERKLNKYELEPGYDMSVNANLLIIKQKALEKEKEWQELCDSEITEITKTLKNLYEYWKGKNKTKK